MSSSSKSSSSVYFSSESELSPESSFCSAYSNKNIGVARNEAGALGVFFSTADLSSPYPEKGLEWLHDVTHPGFLTLK